MAEETPYPTSQQIRYAIDVRYAESDNDAAKLVAEREARLLCDTQPLRDMATELLRERNRHREQVLDFAKRLDAIYERNAQHEEYGKQTYNQIHLGGRQTELARIAAELRAALEASAQGGATATRQCPGCTEEVPAYCSAECEYRSREGTPPAGQDRAFDPEHSPGHTDLMVEPEAIDVHLKLVELQNAARRLLRLGESSAPAPEYYEALQALEDMLPSEERAGASPVAGTDWIWIGAETHYHPIIGEPHDGKIYRISHISRANRLAWLFGKNGCVTWDALSNPSAGR